VTGPSDPIPVALLAASIFERLGIPYLIGGSLASTVHGEPRATMDVDFAAHVDLELIEPLAQALGAWFFVDVEDIREAVDRQRSFNAIDRTSFMKVDVHVRPRSGHFAEEIRRARTVRLSPDGSARLATPEDTLLRKLWWYRRGDEGSDRQWRDVLGIVRTVGPTLDRDYLRTWADELGVSDLLERALAGM
jgi:hypothetical protein